MVYFLIPETIANSLLFAILELSNSWGVCNFGWAIFPHFQFWRSHILPFSIFDEQLFAIFNFGWAIFCHFEEQLLSCLWKLICAALSCPPCYNYCALRALDEFSFRPVLFRQLPISPFSSLFHLPNSFSHPCFIWTISPFSFLCWPIVILRATKKTIVDISLALSSAQSLHFHFSLSPHHLWFHLLSLSNFTFTWICTWSTFNCSLFPFSSVTVCKSLCFFRFVSKSM